MEPKLVRGLGRWDLTAVAINTIIGTGIFILPAKVFGLIGSYSLFAFLACAVITGLIVLCFAEVSSRFNSTGGMYLYAREAFGPLVGFEVGWLYWIVRVMTFAANCNALLLYLGFFFPETTQGPLRFGLIAAIVAGLTAVNLLGIRESAIATNIFTVGKLLPLLVFAGIGAFFVQPANFDLSTVPTYANFSEAVLLLIYAYVGFEAAVIPAGETKNPQKNVPFALIAALIVCTILFIAIQAVAIGTFPGLASAERPLADAATHFLGAFGGAFIAIGALISILGNLNGGFLSASRIPFAMAEQGELPGMLARTSVKHKTPVVSILMTAAVMLVIAWWSSFFTAAAIATTTRLLVYSTTCASLPVFRRKHNVAQAQFLAPVGFLLSVLSLGLIVWLLTQSDLSKEGAAMVIAAGAGAVIYFCYRFFGKNRHEDHENS